MNTLTRRVLASVLAFTVVCASLPGYAPGAFAADEGATEDTDPTDLSNYGTYEYFAAKYPNMQKLTSVESGGKTLSSGVYYVPEGETLYFNCDANSTSTPNYSSRNGIVINGDVTIILLNGSRIYARGSNASGYSVPGYAGVQLPKGSNLCLEGAGSFYAYGGKAASGTNGSSGSSAYWTNDNDGDSSRGGNGGYTSGSGEYMYGGTGGVGGNGGAGAGAGIGTNGANGGSAGLPGSGGSFYRTGNDSGDGRYTSGNASYMTSDMYGFGAAAAGTLSVKGSVSLVTSGGAAGSSGTSGSDGSFRWVYWSEGYFAYGGSGGAGGGGGGAGASVGKGGNGGNGGRGGNGGGAGQGRDNRDHDGDQLWADFYTACKPSTPSTGSSGSTGSRISYYSTASGNYPEDECEITIEYDEQKEKIAKKTRTAGKDEGGLMFWTGEEVEPQVTVVHVPTGTTISKDSGYTVSYSLNTDAAQSGASIEVVGTGTATLLSSDMRTPASDLKIENFSVVYNPATLKIANENALSISAEGMPAYRYTGESIEEGILVHSETNIEVPTEAYSLSHEGSVDVGKVSVSASGMGESWLNDDFVNTNYYIVAPVEIATPAKVFRNIVQGVAYEQAFTYEDPNPEPYNTLKNSALNVTWKVENGSLPAGLSLDARTGVVSGVPTDSKPTVAELSVTTNIGTSETVQYAWHFADLYGYAKTASSTPIENVRVAVYTENGLELPGCSTVTDKNGYWGVQIPESSIGAELVVRAVLSAEESAKPKQILSIGGDKAAVESGKVVTVPARGELVQCDILVEQITEARFVVGMYGTLDPGSEVFYGDPADTVPVPKVHNLTPGYTFLGWSTEEGSMQTVEIGTFGADDTVYYAVYDSIGYTVNYTNTGDTSVPSRTNVQYGDVNLLPTVTKEGYRLTGWRLSGTSTAVTSKTSYGFLANQNGITAASITLEPVWAIRTDINVALHANGTETEPATFSDGNTTHFYANQTYGTRVDWATPQRDGYVLAGWSRTANVEDMQTAVSLAVPDPGEDETDVAFYAVWVPAIVTVMFDAMGGTADYKVTGSKGDPLVAPADPTFEGRTFLGWYDNPTGGKKVDSLPTQIPMFNTTYYARWSLDDVLCKFWMYDELHQELKGAPGTAVPYTAPERVGYTFVGWKVKGAENSKATLILAYPDRPTEYEAVFELGRQIVVVFDVRGGIWVEEGETGERRGIIDMTGTVPANPTRPGYTFGGWYTDLENEDTLFNATEFVFPSDSVTTYSARWDPITISVTLDWNFPDAPPIAPTNNVVAEAIRYSEPVRIGYTFLGWGRKPFDTEYTKSIVTPETDEKSVTFYAQWLGISTSVTLDPAGGKFGSSKEPVTIEGIYETVVDYVTPSRAGYTFVGWCVVDDADAPLLVQMAFPKTPTTYKAVWKALSVGVPEVSSGNSGSSLGGVSGSANGDNNSYLETIIKPDGTIVTIIEQENGSVKGQIVDSNGFVIDLEEQKNIVNPIIAHVSTCSRGSDCPLTQYHDTLADSWYHDGVHHCVEQSLLIGVDNERFAPEEVTTRSMVVITLWRMEGMPIVSTDIPYADVAPTDWCADPVRWAVSIGLLSDYISNSFDPNEPITREQIAVMLYRYALYKGYIIQEPNVDILAFSDADQLSDWAIFAMQWMKDTNLIIGLESGLLNPQGYTVRAQVASILTRFYTTVAQDWIHTTDERKPEEEERKPGDYE